MASPALGWVIYQYPKHPFCCIYPGFNNDVLCRTGVTQGSVCWNTTQTHRDQLKHHIQCAVCCGFLFASLFHQCFYIFTIKHFAGLILKDKVLLTQDTLRNRYGLGVLHLDYKPRTIGLGDPLHPSHYSTILF